MKKRKNGKTAKTDQVVCKVKRFKANLRRKTQFKTKDVR